MGKMEVRHTRIEGAVQKESEERYTVVTLLSHCWYAVGTLLVHYCYTAVTLSLHCCYRTKATKQLFDTIKTQYEALSNTLEQQLVKVKRRTQSFAEVPHHDRYSVTPGPLQCLHHNRDLLTQ
jgi:hypothetical protein